MSPRVAARFVVALVTLLASASCQRKPDPAKDPPHDAPAPSAAPSASSASGPVKCGTATCGPGEICCNESCSICTPPDGACTMQVCDPPPAQPQAPPPRPPPKAACKIDADCATFSSYCGDLPCACLAVAKGAGPPKCAQPNAVKCLVDPCQHKAAGCQGGACVITAK